MRCVIRAASAVVLLAGVVLGVPAGAGAVSAPTWADAIPTAFVAGVQNTVPRSYFDSVSCVSAGNCTAAGQFKDVSGNTQAFTQTSTGGVWADAVPTAFASGVQNTVPNSYFYSVSCVSAGNCTAAGQFKDVSGYLQAFTQTSTAGVWADAVPAAFAAGIQNAVPDATFRSVSCVSAGNCTAAGQFKDVAGYTQAFTLTLTGGAWADAVPAAFAAGVQNASPDAYFKLVSCVSAGDCTAAGQFKDVSGNRQAFTQTSTGGVWADAVPAAFAAGVQNTVPNVGFRSVSCGSAGNCTAAGQFTDVAGYTQAFTLTSTGGVWADAVPAAFVAGVQNAVPYAIFYSVSCGSTGNCTAAGRFKDVSGNRQAFTQTSMGGVWADAVPAAFASGVQSTVPSSYFYWVSCVSVGDCTAAGQFMDVSGNTQAFTQTSAGPTLPPTGGSIPLWPALALVVGGGVLVLVVPKRRRAHPTV